MLMQCKCLPSYWEEKVWWFGFQFNDLIGKEKKENREFVEILWSSTPFSLSLLPSWEFVGSSICIESLLERCSWTEHPHFRRFLPTLRQMDTCNDRQYSCLPFAWCFSSRLRRLSVCSKRGQKKRKGERERCDDLETMGAEEGRKMLQNERRYQQCQQWREGTKLFFECAWCCPRRRESHRTFAWK